MTQTPVWTPRTSPDNRVRCLQLHTEVLWVILYYLFHASLPWGFIHNLKSPLGKTDFLCVHLKCFLVWFQCFFIAMCRHGHSPSFVKVRFFLPKLGVFQDGTNIKKCFGILWFHIPREEEILNIFKSTKGWVNFLPSLNSNTLSTY